MNEKSRSSSTCGVALNALDLVLDQVEANPNITVFEQHMAIDLITTKALNDSISWEVPHLGPCEELSGNKPLERCIGAYIYDVVGNRVRSFAARAIFLATGGASRVYLYTSNNESATGDGTAMYVRLGYPVVNTEQTHFHPTCVWNPNPKTPRDLRFLISSQIVCAFPPRARARTHTHTHTHTRTHTRRCDKDP
eukprot:RCo011377